MNAAMLFASVTRMAVCLSVAILSACAQLATPKVEVVEAPPRPAPSAAIVTTMRAGTAQCWRYFPERGVPAALRKYSRPRRG
jgi:hypothetical protein